MANYSQFTPRGKSFRLKINSGMLLIISALVAILWANSPWADLYHELWSKVILIQVGDFQFFSPHGQGMTLFTFINDALMTLFFFSVGLEIKREVLVGELSSIKKAMFPIMAALGGMLVPVLTFFFTNQIPEANSGIPISMATDIAFSLGVLSMFSKRVPLSLKIFLTTLAVADDIGGIIVIAIYYSGQIYYEYLLYAGIVLSIMFVGGYYLRIRHYSFFLILGLVFWMLFIETGIHATIAGVIAAMIIPARPSTRVPEYVIKLITLVNNFPLAKSLVRGNSVVLSKAQIVSLKQIESISDRVISPLQKFEDSLGPFVSYLVMPLFALANAGIVFSGIGFGDIFSGLSLTVILSLLLGKFVGIFSASFLAHKFKIAEKPHDINWKMIAGVSVLGGIGFTVSLFISNLSFPNNPSLLNEAKIGIVLGSLIAGCLGYIILNKVLPQTDQKQ